MEVKYIIISLETKEFAWDVNVSMHVLIFKGCVGFMQSFVCFLFLLRVLDTLDGCLIGWEICLISNGRCMAAGRVRLFALVFAVVLRVLNQHQHQQQGAD